MGCLQIFLIIFLICLVVGLIQIVFHAFAVFWLAILAAFAASHFFNNYKNTRSNQQIVFSILAVVFGVLSFQKSYQDNYKKYVINTGMSDKDGRAKIYNDQDAEVAEISGKTDAVELTAGKYKYISHFDGSVNEIKNTFYVNKDQTLSIDLPKKEIADTSRGDTGNYGNSSSGSSYVGGSSSYSNYSSSNDSYSSGSSYQSSGSKDVYVHGYSRSDGTYVAPYYRSRPSY